MHGSRRSLALVASALALAGCESHELTRPPDPPLTSGDEVIIVVAFVLAGLVWTACCVGVLARGQALSMVRWAAGAFYTAAAVVIIGSVGFLAAGDLRATEILGDGDCREIPVEDRPHTIVQLHCDDLSGAGTLLGLAYGTPLALLGLACALDVFHSRRPFASTGLAVLVTVLIVVGVIQAEPDEDVAGGLLALPVAAALAAAGVHEVRRARDPGRTRFVGAEGPD